MKPAEFTYQRPASLAQALAALAATPDAKVLAGGQSLTPLLSMRLANPAALIDINGVDELSHINVDETGVRFGAIVRHSQLLDSEEVRAVQPMVNEALAHVAHATIRNRGTTVGSIVHADASGEMPVIFTLLGGTMTVVSAERGSRQITGADLFLGPLETDIADDEIATEVFLPALQSGHGIAFDEISRRHGDYALCGVGAIVGVDESGAVTSAKAGYVSVSETPAVVDFTDILARRGVDKASLEEAADLALAQLEPEGDIHATAHYRAHLARILTRRVVAAAHRDAIARTTERKVDA